MSWWRRNLATVAVTVAASSGVLYLASDRIANMVAAGYAHAKELRTPLSPSSRRTGRSRYGKRVENGIRQRAT